MKQWFALLLIAMTTVARRLHARSGHVHRPNRKCLPFAPSGETDGLSWTLIRKSPAASPITWDVTFFRECRGWQLSPAAET